MFAPPEAFIPPPKFADGWGVNVHFTDAPASEWRKLSAAFRWVRMDLFWHAVEPTKGTYDYSAYDRFVREAVRHGRRVLFILDYGNVHYEKGPPVLPTARAAYVRFAIAAVKRYAGRGFLWEIWNEPNHAQFWSPRPDPVAYSRLVRETVAAIRRVAPGERIVGPALSGFDDGFLRPFLASGAADGLDAITVHPYRGSDPETVVDDVARWRDLLDARPGTRGKPILSGEWGYSSAGMPESRQAAYAIRQRLATLAAGMAIHIQYDWKNDGPDPKENEHNFGTVRADLREKPAYAAIARFVRVLGDHSFEATLDGGSPRKVVYRFRRGDFARDVLVDRDAPEALPAIGSPRRRSPLPSLPREIVAADRASLASTLAGWRRVRFRPVGPVPAFADLLRSRRSLTIRRADDTAPVLRLSAPDRWTLVRVPPGPGRAGSVRAVRERGARSEVRLVTSRGQRWIADGTAVPLPGERWREAVALSLSGGRVRFPAVRAVPVDLRKLTGSTDGDPKVAGEATVTQGRFRYRSDPGWKYAEARFPAPMPVPEGATEFGLWLRASHPGHTFRMRFVDASGTTWQPESRIDGPGWRYVVFRLDDPTVGHWGGRGDRIRAPLRLTTALLAEIPGAAGGTGTITLGPAWFLVPGSESH